ncbi:integral membrane protein [Talaromyces stipitatus ATCC 10500]|uniref:Integral membrane protein n=1 Tax=Talaromyces stipitatus (strain ATCC 10500 / CBS 375.48 / QM 6759 / NRRL 1006) TaxID=441959 RepID=B8MD97_TALSN|nr:uncharacterized protein TSTA_114350 [Talaromyces stipitatus ATCC 10500]EED17622.1 integral membrane protein [Talaromyces stipitatus ATCC 10500]
MPVISRLFSVLLRLAELACAAVVAGIVGYYLHRWSDDHLSAWAQGRWIYTEVIAGLSLLLGLLWLIPTAHTFFIWPIDIIISLCWFAAFGLLVDALDGVDCGTAFSWGYIGHNDWCGRWKAAEAFSFLSAIIWLVSGILGIYFVWRVDRRRNYVYGRYSV